MTGAMYAAISGLKAHMSKLNVIGNNIANVNTHGYKSQRVIFQDALYTTSRSGSNGTSTIGGRNPNQIGYGSVIGTIDLDMSTGNYAPGKSSDCMINGDGFFLVGNKDVADTIDPTDPTSLKALTLTRVGNIEFGPDGYLVDGAGNVIYGFLSTGVDKDGKPMMCDQLVPIRLPRMYEADVLDDNGDVVYKKGSPIFPTGPAVKDKDGKPVTTKAGETIKDGWPLDKDGKSTEPEKENPTDPDPENKTPYMSVDSISFDENTGAITCITKETDEPVVIGYMAIGNVTNPNGVTHMGGPYYKCLDGAGDLKVCLLGGAAKDLGLTTINGSKLKDDEEAAKGMTIDNGGTTALVTGGLELSKADLATEISEMITTQRGYQANTRIITVTDSMLEELVNMKR